MCTVYPVRPKQCKTFPWWQENLSSEEAWKEASQGCEGINHPDAPPDLNWGNQRQDALKFIPTHT